MRFPGIEGFSSSELRGFRNVRFWLLFRICGALRLLGGFGGGETVWGTVERLLSEARFYIGRSKASTPAPVIKSESEAAKRSR